MPSPPHPSPRRWPLVAAMLAVVGLATALAVWDLERQSGPVVDRLGGFTLALARSVARELPPGAPLDSALVSRVGAGEGVAFFLHRAGALVDPAGRPVASEALQALVAGAEETRLLAREEAAALGLPERRAVAARAALADGAALVLVTSAAPERRRARREEWLLAGSLVAVALVAVALGGVALRREGERLALVHEVERTRLERERDEQLARAERVAMASALSLGVAHELATPLGVIAARVEQLQAGLDEERRRAALARIDEQVEQMRRIIQGFLALARGEAPRVEAVAAAELARRAAAAVRHRFSHAGVTLELELEEGLPPVPVDEPLFQQALANLLVNAAQASPRGSTAVLRARREGPSVLFEVCDRGAGLDPAVRDQVTRPFVTTRGTSGGTGLGLAITTEILRHHGGGLRLEPREGGGLVARITLPASGRASPP